ncbi:MAG: type I secretion system permease/ATPase, partial [Burkholderiaceae bacterium]|nr:type I secretion system permease/ATPase [Burkholderiaceae bacterium]
MPANAARSRSYEPESDTSTGSPVVQDTGLTCLLILARFHDLPADGAQIRHQYAQSGQALSDVDLLRAAKHLGLKAGLVKTRWNDLSGTPLPAMAKQKDGRYMVLAKVDGEKVLVQDPVEARPLVLTREQFEAIWTGELLLCTKRANVRPQDLKFDFTWFIPAIVKYRKFFGEVLIASLFLQLFALLTPLFTQVVIDKVLVHKGFTTLHVLAIGMIALAVFETLLGGLRTYLFAHTTNRIDVSLGAQLFRHILALPISYFEARRVGDTVARVRELEQIRQFLTSHSVTVVLDV